MRRVPSLLIGAVSFGITAAAIFVTASQGSALLG